MSNKVFEIEMEKKRKFVVNVFNILLKFLEDSMRISFDL